MILPVCLCGYKTWAIKEEERRRLRRAQINFLEHLPDSGYLIRREMSTFEPNPKARTLNEMVRDRGEKLCPYIRHRRDNGYGVSIQTQVPWKKLTGAANKEMGRLVRDVTGFLA
jgi:hypothetical protein